MKRFRRISRIAVRDLFELQPTTCAGYILNDIQNSECSILAPNLWSKYFKMFKIDEIIRRR